MAAHIPNSVLPSGDTSAAQQTRSLSLATPRPLTQPPAPTIWGTCPETYSKFTSQYGEIRDCFAIDAQRSGWLIATLGNSRTHGVIAIDSCHTPVCSDGSMN